MPRYRFFEQRILAAPSSPAQYAKAAGLLAGALLLRVVLPPELSEAAARSIYLLLVIGAAWWGGRRPGLLSAVLGLALLPPVSDGWEHRSVQAIDGAVLLLVFASGLLVALLTSRLRSAAALVAAQRARYALILDGVGDAVLVGDQQGRLEYFNEGARRLFGVSETGLGHSLVDAADATQGLINASLLARALVGETANDSVSATDEKGLHAHYAVHYRPHLRADGKDVDGVIVHALDQTEQKQIEQELIRSSREHLALAESVPQLVWIADPDGRMLYLNRRWVEFSGLSGERDWTEAVHPDDAPELTQRLSAALNESRELNCEVRLRRAQDGVYRWHVLRALPVADGEQTRRWYGAFTDIEDQKQAQELLRRAQAKTQSFLATLSHELRNPLAVLTTSAHLLGAGPDRTQLATIAGAIQRQTLQLQRMIDELLDISRITQGKIQLQLEGVDLGEIVREACRDFTERMRAQEVRLDCRLPREPAWLHADGARIRQIVDNLLTNAFKAARAGGTVLLQVEAEPGHWVLRVSDDGDGIHESLLGRMFEPFVQGLAWREGGLGLGLSVVAQLTELHGGSVRAHNRPEGGACFEVRLPAGAQLPAAKDAPVPVVAARSQGKRVLVVDDVVDHAIALNELLRADGFDAQAVHSGEEAVAWMERFDCDAVICDIGLPEPWNGYRVAEHLRASRGSRLLLVAYSGFGAGADVQKAQAAGFDRHLLKPTRPAELVNVLRRGLDEKHQGATTASL